MNTSFDFATIQSTEFGVCYDIADKEHYFQVPVDRGVQGALVEMLVATRSALAPGEGTMEVFEPAQKYGMIERLETNLAAEHFAKVRQLYEAENISPNPAVLREPRAIAFYFATFRDATNTKLVAVRRASQFKGVLKARNRLVSLIDDTLKIVEDDIFRLDQDFDYLIFRDSAWILRPSGFEYTAAIEESISAQALQFTEDVAKSVPCVDFSRLQKFVSSHRRAARLIASLRTRADLHLTSPKKLKRGCKKNDIEVVEENGKLYPQRGSEMAFLELLDRRRYTVELVEEQEELYMAGNRRGIARHAMANGSQE